MIVLPAPPSLNALFKNVPGKGRSTTKAYDAWRTEAGWEIKRQRPRVVAGEYALDIFVPPGRKDVDNAAAKAVADLLVSLQITPDDKHARRVATEVVETLPPGEVHCIVRPWTEVGRIADQFHFGRTEGRR